MKRTCTVLNYRMFAVVRQSLNAMGVLSLRLSLTRTVLIHYAVLLVFFLGGLTFYASLRNLKNSSLKYRSLNICTTYGSSVANYDRTSYFLEPYEFAPVTDKSSITTEFRLVFDKTEKSNSIDQTTLNEALNTLGAANANRLKGDTKKAAKLYEHAISLQPKHPKILVEYGLYVEAVRSDVLTACSLYTKALILWPDDCHAKKHFSRTLPLVEEIDSQMLRILDQKRERFVHIPRGSAALKRLMRESYVEHIYHTVALEGNTMSLGQTRSILETHMAVSGKSVMEHNEILGLDAALRFINRSLIHNNEPLSIQDVLQIHKRVFGYVDPMEAGQFRRTQVFVGGFTPPLPDKIEQEMGDFIEWLSPENIQRIHPVELAALVHYKFVIIHPFIDGNGRTARILMNLFLMKAGFPPVIIKLEERAAYYETLKMANDGDLRPFIRFVASCTERTLDTYLTFTTEISSPRSPVNESDRIITNLSDDEYSDSV